MKLQLSELQRDALNEVVNVAVGSAAATLSSMIGRKIEIHVPLVEILPLEQIIQRQEIEFKEEPVGVSIRFDGLFGGKTTLYFESQHGKTLVDNLLSLDDWEEDWDEDWDDEEIKTIEGVGPEFSDTDKEALIEVGNIIINGLMGAISNLLQSTFTYHPPEIHFGFDQWALNSAKKLKSLDRTHALIMETAFHDETKSIEGFLALVFEIGSSMDRFITALDKMLGEVSADDEEF